MPRWTPESRKHHSTLMQKKIHDWKPWERSTGPVSVEGKQISSDNSLKHGWYSMASQQRAKMLRNYIRQCKDATDSEYSHKIIQRML